MRNVELRDEKENAIDTYMDTQAFKDLMTAHDSLIYPEYYKDGWEAAVKVILAKHPGAFDVADFPCPPATLPEGMYTVEDEMEEDMASPGPSPSAEQEKTPPAEASSSSGSNFSSSSSSKKSKEGETKEDTSPSKDAEC